MNQNQNHTIPEGYLEDAYMRYSFTDEEWRSLCVATIAAFGKAKAEALILSKALRHASDGLDGEVSGNTGLIVEYFAKWGDSYIAESAQR